MNTLFPKLVITEIHYLGDSFEDSRWFNVPNRIYTHGGDRVQTVEDALEVVFRQLNAVDGNELISEPEFRQTTLDERWRHCYLPGAGWMANGFRL